MDKNILIDSKGKQHDLLYYSYDISTSDISTSLTWGEDTSSNFIDNMKYMEDYLSYLSKLLNIDLPSFDEFKNMSESDKNIYLRDHKINEILK